MVASRVFRPYWMLNGWCLVSFGGLEQATRNAYRLNKEILMQYTNYTEVGKLKNTIHNPHNIW